MRRITDRQVPADLPSGDRDRETGGARVLVVMGSVGFLPVAMVMWIVGQANLQSAWHSIQWTSVSAFLQSAERWMRSGLLPGGVTAIIWIFSIGYCVLLWQWIAVAFDERKRQLSPYLWAFSTAYFVAVILVIAIVSYDAAGSAGEWLKWVSTLSSIPTAFLTITVPLCLMAFRSGNAAFALRNDP